MLHSRKILLFSLLFCAVLLTQQAFGHGGDSSLIHACVNASSGSVKLVSPDAVCEKNWYAVDWSIQGPPGPQDPVLLGRIAAIENQLAGIQAELAAITDQLTPPDITISDIAVQEGDAVVTISLSKPYANTVTVNYATLDGTAIQGQDYQSAAGIVEFIPGEVTKTVQISGVVDVKPELDETFQVLLSGVSNANLLKSTATITLLNDDFPTIRIVRPTGYFLTGFAPSDQSYGLPLREGEFTQLQVTLSLPAPFPVTVNYGVTGNLASANVDFVADNGLIEFAAGEIVRDIVVSTLEDVLAEGDEDFVVSLNNANNGILSPTDSAVRFSIVHSDINISVGDAVGSETGGIISFEIGVTSAVDAPIYLFPSLIDGTALVDQDVRVIGLPGNSFPGNCREGTFAGIALCDAYASNGSRIVIPAGQLSTVHDVAFVRDDSEIEGSETLGLKVLDYTSFQAAGGAVGTGTILDND